MRLSPKLVFLAMVALGLPIALSVGWQLASPPPSSPDALTPGGSGAIGAAPTHREATSSPMTRVDYWPGSSNAEQAQPSQSGAAPATPTSIGTPTSGNTPPPQSAATATATATTGGLPGLPTLTLPPVPTPTEVPSPPPTPSATPSETSDPESHLLDRARWRHRP